MATRKSAQGKSAAVTRRKTTHPKNGSRVQSYTHALTRSQTKAKKTKSELSMLERRDTVHLNESPLNPSFFRYACEPKLDRQYSLEE